MSKTQRRAFLAIGGASLLAAGYVGFEVARDRGDILLSHLSGFWNDPPVGPDGNPDGGEQHCRTPESLTSFDELAGGVLGYEVTGTPTPMKSDPRFLDLLQTWATNWSSISGLGPIKRVWSYGAHTDKCNSWHQAGRAFDIARIEHENGTISCRFDEWAPGKKSELRNYWRLAASLQDHFAYTLTHLYNSQHDNHIHIDNSVNGYEATIFDDTSRVQNQLIQATLKHVHGQTVEITGTWDDQTRTALRRAQQTLGITQPMNTPEGWHTYLQTTAKG